MVRFHSQFIFLALLLVHVLTVASSTPSSSPHFPIAKPGCNDRCGNVSIPFPFGTTPDCYLNDMFSISCNNNNSTPRRQFLHNNLTTNLEITDISLDRGQLTLLNYLAHECYLPNGTRASSGRPGIWLSDTHLTVNSTENIFTIIGCDTFGYVYGRRHSGRYYQNGCMSMCGSPDDMIQGSCTGMGCCQIPIPGDVSVVQFNLGSFSNYTNVSTFNNCSYSFVVDRSAFTFSPENLTNLRDVDRLPMVIDWAVGNGTCEEARMLNASSSYACKGVNVACHDGTSSGGYNGYRCSCKEGYQGNPYLENGCRDINECDDPSLNTCQKKCVNTHGGFNCVCPKGYDGDGRKDGKGCIRGESLVYKLATGIALGVIVLLLSACWFHLGLKRRNQIKMRQKYFVQNGGILLQEQLTRTERLTSDTTKVFSEFELQKATDNFDSKMIVGQGGFGTVYKGLLSDNKIVAIKKSKAVDPNQIEQFINEVIVLSQINHRNVVKLLGCCLETQAPLLVYEFISNGTLFEHVHNKAKARSLSWDMRLKLATETASVLSYLHSSASTPIIHRDVKSANILLDHTFTAKVSDFGSSRLVPLDQTQLSTMVQGTFGYLDPEYMQTNQLTEKSDVYSFGVVLIELLTGMKALSYDRPEEERSLANYFLSVMKQKRLFEILEENVAREGNKERVIKVAELAKSCLNVKGDDRPYMKEVALELEGLKVGAKHAWVQSEHNAEDMGFLTSDGFVSSFTNNADNSKSIGFGFDSIRDHTILPVEGGR